MNNIDWISIEDELPTHGQSVLIKGHFP